VARNFGIRRQIISRERAPVWPLVVLTAIVISVINLATFLPHR
jgi:multisubunit Na+/H+ antiporter MnhC subunit